MGNLRCIKQLMAAPSDSEKINYIITSKARYFFKLLDYQFKVSYTLFPKILFTRYIQTRRAFSGLEKEQMECVNFLHFLLPTFDSPFEFCEIISSISGFTIEPKSIQVSWNNLPNDIINFNLKFFSSSENTLNTLEEYKRTPLYQAFN